MSHFDILLFIANVLVETEFSKMKTRLGCTI